VTSQAAEPRLVLASASASRRGLMTAAGLAFTARAAAIDEGAIKAGAQAEGISAEDTAVLLAELKAQRVAGSEPDALVIGSDQLLVCGKAWFNKPQDIAAARAQLLALRGQTHVLVTAVVCWRGGERIWHHVAKPRLVMRDFSEAFLDDYLAHEGEAVTTSVGAYRLEGMGMHLFDAITGEHAAILGLPMMALLGFLRQQRVLLR